MAAVSAGGSSPPRSDPAPLKSGASCLTGSDGLTGHDGPFSKSNIVDYRPNEG